MFVQLEKHDVVVVRSHMPAVGEVLGQDVIVVYSEESEQFSTLWARHDGDSSKYTLMWRGNFDGCLKEFGDIVGDIFIDYLSAVNSAAREKDQ